MILSAVFVCMVCSFSVVLTTMVDQGTLVHRCPCLQSDFGGHDNVHHDQLFAFVGAGFHVMPQPEGHVDTFYNNKVILTVRLFITLTWGGGGIHTCYANVRLRASPPFLTMRRRPVPSGGILGMLCSIFGVALAPRGAPGCQTQAHLVLCLAVGWCVQQRCL
jgi:hypothetical protein